LSDDDINTKFAITCSRRVAEYQGIPKMLEWDKILKDSVKDGTIRELHLRKIPSLKTCDDWNKVVEIGLIDYKGKYAHMKGGLINYGERIFFVSESRIEALSSFRKWNFKNKIRIKMEETGKKK
jgi:hypothetical protein